MTEVSPILLENRFQHVLQKLNFDCGFIGNRLGLNARIDHVTSSGFHTTCDFEMRFACQSLRFPENHDFHVLCSNNLVLFGGHGC